MIIKSATIGDIKEISKIHALSWKAAYKNIIPENYLKNLKDDFWVEHFTHIINRNVNKVNVIYKNDILIGCISYGESKDERFSMYGEIFSMYILPEHFGKGYGKKLLTDALDDLKNLGYSKVILWVLKDNKDAISFYEKNGFIESDYVYDFEIMNKKLQTVNYILDIEKTL